MKNHSFQHYSHDVGAAVHDAWITTRVKSALAFADTNLALHINVKTHAGTVALSGRVNTHKQCEQAVAIARSVPGVAEVDAKELLTHVFTPGGIPEPPNAEESAEDRTQSSKKIDDQ
ncbi:Osmotically-inducible protein Y precursor [compost metagenome]|uniref:BON domain-containing protein n=1 Tax=Pseudomonas sp. Irchel s3h17 TaxID=2009182 RepID=UPI000BA4005F|nr:BON domain-containing protein [Pseudomonas sp. Irchel s3h17]